MFYIFFLFGFGDDETANCVLSVLAGGNYMGPSEKSNNPVKDLFRPV
jgi:hypothetical protein